MERQGNGRDAKTGKGTNEMRYILSIVLVLLFGANGMADDYYCIFFASDCMSPRYCHVWGTFIQMKDKELVKEVTISWAPTTAWNVLDQVKPGYNMSLEASMKLSGKNATCFWGPYTIKEDLFQRAEESYNRPWSYKTFDVFVRHRANNCIHHLGSVSGSNVVTNVRYGKYAMTVIHKHYLNNNLIMPLEDSEKVMNGLFLYRYKLRKMDP